MADYSNSKNTLGSVFPDRAVAAQEWGRVEPLITPQQLKDYFLFGIPLYSMAPDPVTGLRAEVTTEMLKSHIERAVAQAELDTGLTIFPVQYDERHPFDRNFWLNFGYTRVEHRPVASLEKFAFTPASGNAIFEINLQWVDNAQFHKGQINLIPFVPAVAAQFVPTGNSSGNGSAYLQILQGISWVPSLVETKYTAGFPDGKIPVIINEVIGTIAAMNVLSMLQATFRFTSNSINIDGQGQSQAGPGPTVYQGLIDSFAQKKDSLVKKLKNIYGLQIFSSNV